MSSWRHRAVSLAAVSLAMATGVVLGDGPLQRTDPSGTQRTDGEGPGGTAADAGREQPPASSGVDAAVVEAAAPLLLAHRLQGRSLTLVVLPGADDAQASRIEALAADAGARVGATVHVREPLLDLAGRPLVAELARQLRDEPRRGDGGERSRRRPAPSPAEAYAEMGRLFAGAVATRENAGSEPGDRARGVLAAIRTAGLVDVDEEPRRRGSVVVVLAAGTRLGAVTDPGAVAIAVTVARALDRASDGVVVVGPAPSGAPEDLGADGDVLSVLRARSAGSVSTVETHAGTAGAMLALLAAAEQVRGRSAHYDGDDPILPAR